MLFPQVCDTDKMLHNGEILWLSFAGIFRFWYALIVFWRNLLDTRPPLVNVEQAYDGFTHDPKGRQLKLAVTYKLGR